MDTHVRTLSTLNILFGVFSVVLSLTVLIVFGGPISIYTSMDDNILGVLLASSTMFHMLLAVPCIVGGIYLRSYTEWARGVLTVTSALNILNIPVGSVVGAYGLWVMLAEETDPLFSNPPPDRRIKKVAPVPEIATTPAEAQPKKSAATTIIPSPRS